MAGLGFDFLVRDKATRTFKDIDRAASKTHKTFGRMSAGIGTGAARVSGGIMGIGKSFLGLTAVVGGGAALLKFGQESISEAREAEKVGKTTAQIIKSTGGAAKITAGQVGALSTALSNKAGIDDEVIQQGANLLLTFKNVRNEVGKGNQIFNRATSAAVDLSAAGFGSVDSASKMLGKALNDPLKGISALGRAGVTFTDGQKKQIKTLVEHGHTLKAQKLILKEVESQVGGVAAANATAGEKAKVAWGNFKEAIGTKFLPVWDKVLGGFTKGLPAVLKFGDTVSKQLGPAFKIASDAVGAFFKGIAGGKAGGSGPLVTITNLAGKLRDTFQEAWPVVQQLFGQIGATAKALLPVVGQAVGVIITLVSKIVSTALPIIKQIFTTITGAIRQAMPQIKSSMESIRVIVSGVLDIIKALWQKFGPTILLIVKTVFGTLFKVISGVLSAIAGVIKLVMALIHGDWGAAWDAIKQIVAGVWKAMKAIIVGAFTIWKALISAELSLVKAIFSRVWDGIKKLISAAWDSIKRTASDRLSKIKTTLGNAWTSVKTAVKNAWNSVKTTIANAFTSIVNKITTFARSAPTRLLNAGKNLFGGLAKGMRDKLNSVGDWFKGIKDKIASFTKTAPGRLVSAGKSLLSGLKSGMLSALSNASKWFSSIGSKIVSGVKHFFGIKSPSRVFMGLGGHLISGLIKGMLNANPVAAARKVFGSMTGALRSMVGKGLIGVGHLSGKALDALGGSIGSGISLKGAPGRNQRIAAAMLGRYGWGGGQMSALSALWMGESGWNQYALNRSSGAYGIPQALPARKMASAGSDWRTNPATQIAWGLQYIKSRYGSPVNALMAWQNRHPHWYGKGGLITEPVIGMGLRTGQSYGFGEKGVETVIPGNAMAGGGNAYITINCYGNNPRETAKEVHKELLTMQKNGHKLGFVT